MSWLDFVRWLLLAAVVLLVLVPVSVKLCARAVFAAKRSSWVALLRGKTNKDIEEREK